MRALSAAVCLLVALLVVQGDVSPARGATSTVEISSVGDIAMAPSSDGGAGFFSHVQSALTGDVVLGNLEGTLASGGASKCSASSRNCYAFRAPPSYAGVLRRAGFTIMNLANNHALDYGPTGQAQTIRALDRARLRHTGRPGEITYVRIGSARVAVLGFAPTRGRRACSTFPPPSGSFRRRRQTRISSS